MIEELELDIHALVLWFRGGCPIICNADLFHDVGGGCVDQGQDQHSDGGGDNAGQQTNQEDFHQRPVAFSFLALGIKPSETKQGALLD